MELSTGILGSECFVKYTSLSPSVQLADEHGVKFMETSAKSGLNVETVSNTPPSEMRTPL